MMHQWEGRVAQVGIDRPEFARAAASPA